MKFSDGFWLNKPGYSVNYATQAYEITADDKSVTVFATNQWIQNRGMTLGGPALEITFTSTLENSIKVTVDHYKGQVRKGPFFELYEDSSFKPVINKLENGGYVAIVTLSYGEEGQRPAFSITVRNGDGDVVSEIIDFRKGGH